MTLGLPLQRKNMSEPASKRKEATITAMVTGITAMDASMMWRQAATAPGSTTIESATGWGCQREGRKMSVWKIGNVAPSKGFQMTMKRESALSWCSRGKRQSHETDKGERTICPDGATNTEEEKKYTGGWSPTSPWRCRVQVHEAGTAVLNIAQFPK